MRWLIFVLFIVGLLVGAVPTQADVRDCNRPYAFTSPWNTPISAFAPTHAYSSRFIKALTGTFGSTPFSYTIPVYEVNDRTPLVSIKISNSFRQVSGETIAFRSPGSIIRAPIPPIARGSRGSDGHMVLLNVDSGAEWGFYQITQTLDGQWKATGGYLYNVSYFGVPPKGFAGRGGGSPYLAGLVRKCEIDRGYIDHALVMGYDYPCSSSTCRDRGYPTFIYPAIKTDGDGTSYYDFPEGTRLQLKRNATAADLNAWCGSDQVCRMVVRAMQEYGVYVMENSGHPKVYFEDDVTAHWNGLVTAYTVSRIPYSAFRALAW